MEIKIDSEFKELIPDLQPEEYSTLEKSILSEGCREPLIVWGGVIVDGHNRYNICTQHGIEYELFEKEFSNRDEVKLWMIDNQKGRRNLTDGWKYELAQVKKAILAERGKATQGQRTDLLSNTDKRLPEPNHNTQKEISQDLGWSTGKTAQADYVWNHGDEEIKEKVKSGDFSINKAYETLRKPHVSNNTGENEWYTPIKFINAAREVMGSIDTDPASSVMANKNVRATQFFTKDDDGLSKEWSGNVWMNPPYAQPLITQFCESVSEKYTSGEIEQAIVLVNNGTETGWFQSLLSSASMVCFPKSRIKFIDKNGNPSGAPLQGQAIVYFGDNTEKFIENFSQFGGILWVKIM